MLFSCFTLFGQTKYGYWFQDSFIQLNKIKNVQKEIKSQSPYRVLGEDTLAYKSHGYLTPSNDTIFIYPEITVKLQTGQSIDGILSHYPSKFSIRNQRNNKYYLDVDALSSDEVLRLACEIKHMDGVDWCEPNISINIIRYNTYYNYQYYLHNAGQTGGTTGVDINVEPAWAIISGGSNNIKTAVIDDGVDLQHEDLSAGLLEGYTLNSNTKGEHAPGTDGQGHYYCHGTACAGIIGARDNSIGIKGIAYNTKLLPVNINLAYNVADIANAIYWAAQRADVISCSWGCYQNSDIIDEITNARTNGRNGKGCVVVYAVGNDGASSIAFPANVSGVISVGSIDKNGNHCTYSNTGPELDLVAPSGACDWQGDVWTTDIMNGNVYNGNYMSYFGGTSAACPQVAGVAALMLSANPDLTESQVKSVLCSTASHIGNTIPNNTYGYGLVDAYEAVKEAVVHNAVFFAPTLLTGTNTYSVSGLPSGTTVVWTLTSGMTTSSVSNDTYSCTITCPSNPPSVFGVTATVYYNGVQIKSFYRSVFTHFSGSYRQDACAYYGVNHPAITSKTLQVNTATYVHMGCNVHVTGYNLKDATFIHSGITPETWYYNGDQELVFSLPYGSSGMPFNIYINGNATTGTHLLFFPVSGNGNLTSSLGLTPMCNGYELTIIDDSGSRDATLDNFQWDVEVYDTLQGQLVYSAHVKGVTHLLDTSSWRAGTYVVRAIIDEDDEPLVEKIQVK